MIGFARRVAADLRAREFGQADREIDVGARIIDAPVAAVAVASFRKT